MTLDIGFGFRDDQRLRVAQILYEAFEGKYAPIFGSDRSVPMIARHLRGDRTVVATIDGTVVGVGGLYFEGKDFIDLTYWQMLQELKWEIFRVLFSDWIFHVRVDEKQLLVDDFAVAEDMRGRGIGTGMLGFIIEFARSKGYEEIKLLVIDKNQRARKLYERMGFREERIRKIPYPWTRLFDFRQLSEMAYRIQRPSSNQKMIEKEQSQI